MAIYCRSLFSPPFFPLLRPSSFLSLRTAGNEAISRARFRLCENFRSHFLIISPSSSTPLPHLAERMALDGPCPSPSLLVPLFQVSTLPSTPANLVLKFRRESNLPAFSFPLSLGESRPPLSAVTLSPYPPLISSVLASRSLSRCHSRLLKLHFEFNEGKKSANPRVVLLCLPEISPPFLQEVKLMLHHRQ